MTAILVRELYKAEVVAEGGRSGHVRSNDGALDLPTSRPGSGQGANPEQLFAAGWAACFLSAVQHAARARGMDGSTARVRAEITLGNEDDGGFALRAALYVSIERLDADIVQALAETAHMTCPYSKATRGNIVVSLHTEGRA